MIFDSLDNLELYLPLIPRMRSVIDVMDRGEVYEMECGSYQSKDPHVRYLISSYETESKEKPYEVHHKATDVEIMLKGEELMSVSWREAVKDADAPYDKDGDVQHTTGEPLIVWHAAPGRFALFLPGEPHKGGVAIGLPSKVKKITFKIYD